MSKLTFTTAVAASLAASVFAAGGSEADKPQGFRFFNQHLTIKPYVALSYTYDSNFDTTHKAESDSIFCVNPGAEFVWKSDRWSLAGTAWYRWNTYVHNNGNMGENSYGESLSYKWATSRPDEKGWTLMLGERYQYINQSDGLDTRSGRGIWRDRQSLDLNGVLERRFTERWHADLLGQYTWLDYKNDTGKYAPLYGWSEWAVGAEAGYAASPWTDLLLAGGYAHYTQHGGHGYRNYSNESEVWSVQGGIATRATEKISYRALLGASWLEYGGHSNADVGWTYSLSANWRITRQLQWSALGSSYYQPSERTRGQAVKVYALSTGLSYLTLGDKMTLSGNIAFRHEDVVYSDRYLAYGNDYDEDFFSARVGADYILNRWMSLFANFTWEEEWCDKHSDYDYHRFRGTVGVRFHY
jgi:hypothetical protein